MEDNIIGLKIDNSHVGLDDSDRDIVSMLEYVLSMARAGKIAGIGMFFIVKEEEARLSYSGNARSSDMINGAAQLFFHAMMKQMEIR